jgi:hypothetical protein
LLPPFGITAAKKSGFFWRGADCSCAAAACLKTKSLLRNGFARNGREAGMAITSTN